MKSIRLIIIISWVVLLSWMIFIFHLSAQPAVLSAVTSRNLSQQILEAIRDDPTPQMVRSFDAFLRNSAHFGVFYVLGLLSYPTFFIHSFKHPFFTSLLFTITYAVTDEIHQIFVEGRAFQFRDLGLDSIGGLLGIVTATLLLYSIRKQLQKRKSL